MKLEPNTRCCLMGHITYGLDEFKLNNRTFIKVLVSFFIQKLISCPYKYTRKNKLYALQSLLHTKVMLGRHK